jgi:cysteinyl-tRNA synthetase
MSIRLFDSLSREIRELKPSRPDGVFRFYNCGLTVYAPGHIGNFRTFVVNDILRRALELEFGPDKVQHVRNITDVDDRTVTQAKKEQRPLGDITQHWTGIFHEDCSTLNLLAPHAEPTATGFIKEQFVMIETLMAKGNAYAAPDGSVYFKIDSFPGYGALSRIKERELLVTNTVADADHKDSVSDFALWKAYKPEEDGSVHWHGPKGAAEGRPGWHIECSAMSKALLGDTIDLHSGGVDLLFPHHENEIAQSECGNGATFSHHWYHSEHLLVDAKKMSKSLGNYYTVRDLLEKGYTAMEIRYSLLAGQPRKQLNFTFHSLDSARSAIKSLRKLAARLSGNRPLAEAYTPLLKHPFAPGWGRFERAWTALCDDLNVPAALGEIFAHSHTLTPEQEREDAAALAKLIFVLGLEPVLLAQAEATADVPAEVVALAEKRWAAKQAKDFATADALRKEIATAGWSMLDGKEGYKLEPLKRG